VSLPWSANSLKEDGCVRPEFVNHLTASAAGRTGNALVVDYRDGSDLDLGSKLGDRRTNRGALGTVGHSIRRILDVATAENFAVREKNGRSDSELRIGRMRVLHNFLGRAQ